MTLSGTTLAALRRAALGAALVATTGLSAAAVTSAHASDSTPATATVDVGPADDAAATLLVEEPAPVLLDGDDCPACGLG